MICARGRLLTQGTRNRRAWRSASAFARCRSLRKGQATPPIGAPPTPSAPPTGPGDKVTAAASRRPEVAGQQPGADTERSPCRSCGRHEHRSRRTCPSVGSVALARVSIDAAAIIGTRIETLADKAVRLRQPWTTALGPQPGNPESGREWLRHVAIIAAYRDQHKLTTDDPRQVLGPHAGHEAYWRAAESVLVARQLAGIEPDGASPADNRATAPLAADIYRDLPADERQAVTAMLAATAGSAWAVDSGMPADQVTAQPACARQLASALSIRGHLTSVLGHGPGQRPADESRPYEAELARRGQPGRGRTRRVEQPLKAAPAAILHAPVQQVSPQAPAVGPSPMR